MTRTRVSFAQLPDRCTLLLVSDLLVLLFVRGRFETLPREASSQEVHEYVTKGFQIITAGLF